MAPRIIKALDITEPLKLSRPDPAPAAEPSAPPATPPAAPFSDPAAIESAAREQGLARGMQAAEEAYRAKLARLDALADSLQRERQDFFDRVEPEVVRLSVSIAEKILARELELRPDAVVDMVRSAVKRLRDREQLRVSVSPRDFEQVRSARDDLIGAIDGVRSLEVVEDRRVDPGGCVIESQNGTLDARVKTQLDQLSSVLEGAMPDPQEHEPDGPRPLPGSDQTD